MSIRDHVRRRRVRNGNHTFREPTENHACYTNGWATLVRVDEAAKVGDRDWGGDGHARWFVWVHEGRDAFGASIEPENHGIQHEPYVWSGEGSGFTWDVSDDFGPLRRGERWRAERIIREVTGR